ncbi:MAG: family 20 glycosylhydrolase [Planctomycetia bacterium]|nr:family 20 glycosylhydrolase [Planctomycetia bacterium]
MKTCVKWVACLALFFSACGSALGFEPLQGHEAWVLKSRVVPTPTKMELAREIVTLDNTLALTLCVKKDQDKALKAVETFFPLWFAGQKPRVSCENLQEEIVPDGYKISARGQTMRIAAESDSGILNALKTLRQLAEATRGTLKTVSFFVPEMEIDDAPKMAFRGIHVCWFPETAPERIEQAIRMAAYYKYNYLVLEFWGVYPFEKYPEFCWKEYATTRAEVEKLVALGESLGIRLIPQINIFGHASWSRITSGKHTTLDFHPEFLPLFEPDGWTWCLSNPNTREVLSNMVLELCEVFDNPPFFHIGCDEAGPCATCIDCRRANYGELFVDHLKHFTNLLAERNCRPMMWHDMLITRQQFPGYVANANTHTKDILGKLPKDLVVCDWQYGSPKENEQWSSMRFFKEQGFDVVACPWNNRAGVVSQAKTVCNAQLYGILVTTWHHLSGLDRMYTMFSVGAQSAWRADHPALTNDNFNAHIRQIGWDMKLSEYDKTGVTDYQIPTQTSGSPH